MNQGSEPEPIGDSIADAESKLARLGVQVEAMQALLVRLLQDVVNAETSIDASSSAPLVEANENLVLAALDSQAKAETAALALEVAEKAAGLDALTGLPNRKTLLDRFSQAIASSKRRGSRSALVFLDLDNFKALNDAHGHPFGDKVLQLAAERMLAAVREVDTVSRHGGDEFLILLTELGQVADAHRVAEKLLASIAAPAQIDGIAVNLTASAGMATYPDDGEDAANLVAQADAAMYESKCTRAGGIALHGKGGSTVAPAPESLVDPDRNVVHDRSVALRDANERLILAALSAQELAEAAELARQRQTAVMAAVAEELSNPQSPIRIATAMLGRVASDEPVLPRVQGILEEQISQMSQLIEHLVGAPGPEAGVLERRLESVDMNAVIDTAVAAHKAMMDARSQHLEIGRPAGGLKIPGDAMMLELIVSNLLDNASKHTYNGGHIVLSVALTVDSIILTVSDNGIGITPAILPYIYSPFVQDTQALGFNGVGMGIGLTVVRTLVGAHGGTLTAHSLGLKRGSRFVVTLPADVPERDGAAGTHAPRDFPIGG